MRTRQVFEYIGIGLLIVVIAVLMTDSLRNRLIGYFKSKPYLELSGTSPSQLNITEFSWGYGITAINQFNGDFDTLDEKVFDLLKGKAGLCQLYLQETGKDKYGNGEKAMTYIGDIDINELSKFQSWKYWQQEAGIRTILYKKYLKQDSNITVDSLAVPTTSAPVDQPATVLQPVITYSFSIDDLYPTEEKQNDFDQHPFDINGVIADVNFETGTMLVATSNDQYTVHFYPLDASSYVAQRLMLALKRGNKISSVCARAGASSVDLLSAEITSSQP